MDYVLTVGGNVSGRHLSFSYLHNMLVPFGEDQLHRVSMGGEFVHYSSQPLFSTPFENANSAANARNSAFQKTIGVYMYVYVCMYVHNYFLI